MKKQLLFSGLLLPLQLLAQIAEPQFVIPIQGTHMQEYYLVNYVDWSLDNIEDFQCGHKTYDGHQGTDFTLRNFAQMDAGVEVYAANDGVVTYLVDGLFDRNKTAVSGGLGNYVAIRHFNDFYTYYGHLKSGSIVVAVGDTVTAGQKIGEVGSSGYSSDPHLHFEVWYDSLYNWDPFSGPCGNASSLWLDSLSYVHEFGVIDHDFTHFEPSLDTLKERLPGQILFSAADPVVTFWMEGFGVFPGDVSTAKWFDPEGNLWFQFDYEHVEEWWYYYFWTYINTPPSDKAGLWTLEYSVNNDLKIRDTFMLSGAVTTTAPVQTLELHAYQNSAGDLVLEWPEHTPFSDEIGLVDAMGKTVYLGRANSSAQRLILPVSKTLSSGVYVLYSKLGRFRPIRLLIVQ